MFKKSLFFTSLFCLVVTTLLNRTGSHDICVLSGIEVATLIFVFSFALLFSSIEKPSEVVIYTSIYIVFLYMLPCLKYSIPLGTGDLYYHLATSRSIYDQGNIPSGVPYSNFPILHILVASTSLVSGIPLIPLLGGMMWVLYGVLAPSLTYTAAKHVFSSERLQKFAVLFSPFLSYGFFVQAGTTAPYLASLFLLAILVCLLKFVDPMSEKQRKTLPKMTLIVLFLIATLVLTHHYTSYALGLGLALTVVFFYIFAKMLREKNEVLAPIVNKFSRADLFLVVVFLVWWMYTAQGILNSFVRNIYNYLILMKEPTLALPALGSGLLKLDFFTWLRFIVLSNSLKWEVVFFSSFGIALFLISIYRRKTIGALRHKLMVALCYITSFVTLFAVQYWMRYGEIGIERFVSYSFLLSPIFACLAMDFIDKALSEAHLNKSRLYKASLKSLKVAFLCFILSFPLIEIYPSEKLPPNTLINRVSSIYQYEMVKFVERHETPQLIIAGDSLTMRQIVGFSGYALYNKTLSEKVGESLLLYFLGLNRTNSGIEALTGTSEGFLFLIHTPGKSGFLYEKYEIPEVENATLIVRASQQKGINLIYNNGESYIVAFIE